MESQLEEMGRFFDARIEHYDEHMLGMFQDFHLYYDTIADAISPTQNPILILDLGCGTGAELEPIFRRAPNAVVTGVDVSIKMLDKLREKHESRAAQLHLIHDSYLTAPLGTSDFDCVVSIYTMHHFTLAVKLSLYQKILQSLKPGGQYIEGDYVVTQEKEQQVWDYYAKLHPHALQSTLHKRSSVDPLLHIDLPCTVPTQMRLFREAGFAKVDLVWHREEEESAIFVATP